MYPRERLGMCLADSHGRFCNPWSHSVRLGVGGDGRQKCFFLWVRFTNAIAWSSSVKTLGGIFCLKAVARSTSKLGLSSALSK